MNKKIIETFIITTLKNIIHNKDNEINNQTKIKNLALDQLDYTQLIIECEEHFDILIDDAHFETLDSVDALVNYILMETEKNIIN